MELISQKDGILLLRLFLHLVVLYLMLRKNEAINQNHANDMLQDAAIIFLDSKQKNSFSYIMSN